MNAIIEPFCSIGRSDVVDAFSTKEGIGQNGKQDCRHVEAKQQVWQAAVVNRFTESGKSVYKFQLTASEDCD
ncbi:hypothetical protein [Rubinisphaera italica]|uniref:hypothetical protein n=1 Tax=Rubinisphaera italica TaxID=2527969 RepID=UPI0011B540AC|nr:hypothetical protein [Rubinisphaera italica]